jgi:hypothetical protein
MTSEQQIKALAELDGFGETWNELSGLWGTIILQPQDWNRTMRVPEYLTSYDAIIPLIQKLWKADVCLSGDFTSSLKKVREWHTISLMEMLTATPSQLCEALLRATGKWTE